MNEIRRDVFQAISDPIRREIILILSKEDLTVNGVAENFKVSRPAISKHLKILVECGLVNIQRHGRDHYCSANYNKLKEVSDWLKYFERFWDQKLNSLQKYLEE
ncbi:MAG TPA: metalloregulator ArsR/SmtB family transcription factor [Ignavibacteriaceae bacterium]|nr:metalloregulator ArsR/SmtB family transcription factor [Ignavibacteriaceae bacterium]